MRLCAELADLGMDLARAAAAKALADLAKPEEPSEAEAPPAPEPASPHLAPAAQPPRAASVRAASAKPADAATIFTRLTATVCHCIALEARLAAGLTATSRAPSPTLRADPRRARLRYIFSRITEPHPDRADLVRETTTRIDENLEADPDRTLNLPTLFFSICEACGIEPDLATLPDEFLGLAEDQPDPEESATAALDPRATSPPWQ